MDFKFCCTKINFILEFHSPMNSFKPLRYVRGERDVEREEILGPVAWPSG